MIRTGLTGKLGAGVCADTAPINIKLVANKKTKNRMVNVLRKYVFEIGMMISRINGNL
jgi:hypothetical protein